MSATKCIHLPIKISGTGYLLDDSGLVMAYCSDGIPCAEMKELVSIANSHAELLEALEAFVDACDKAAPLELMAYIDKACVKARAAIAKARQ